MQDLFKALPSDNISVMFTTREELWLRIVVNVKSPSFSGQSVKLARTLRILHEM